MHKHLCQECNEVWECNDTSGDGSDTDCRWFTIAMCPDCYLKLARLNRSKIN